MDQPKPQKPEAPRYARRLSDKILVAFHHACDQRELEVAGELVGILEKMVNRPEEPSSPNGRKAMEGLVAAHTRLWDLRHQEELPVFPPPQREGE